MITMIASEGQRYWTPPSYKTKLLIYLFFFTFISGLLFLRGCRTVEGGGASDWDVLIFTQHWPNTVCMDWEEQKPTNNTCRMPHDHTSWTVHGIWPTKFGTLGPTFCDSSRHFNISLLVPIMSNLTEYWTDIEVPHPTDSFWRHEWRKHGTCCETVKELSTELDYFKQGLKWLEEYNMRDVLLKGGLQADTNIPTDLTMIWLAVKTTLMVNPSIHCIHDKKTGQYYLQELRICFDKTLTLVDCDGIRSSRKISWKPNGNCPNDKPIFYPATVPPADRKPLPPPPDTSMVTLYKMVQLIMWFTS